MEKRNLEQRISIYASLNTFALVMSRSLHFTYPPYSTHALYSQTSHLTPNTSINLHIYFPLHFSSMLLVTRYTEPPTAIAYFKRLACDSSQIFPEG